MGRIKDNIKARFTLADSTMEPELCVIAFQGAAHDIAAEYYHFLAEKEYTVEVFPVPGLGAAFTATIAKVEVDDVSGQHIAHFDIWGVDGRSGEVRPMDIYDDIERIEVV
jgi:hypothetical protein